MSDEQEMNEEFELLKMEAGEMGVKFRSDIGQEKLQERVDAAIANDDVPSYETVDTTDVDEPEKNVVENGKDESVDAKPARENGFDPEVSEGEAWVDRVAMKMLRQGHGQKNILNRAYKSVGIDRLAGYEKFKNAKGSMREKLIAIFE